MKKLIFCLILSILTVPFVVGCSSTGSGAFGDAAEANPDQALAQEILHRLQSDTDDSLGTVGVTVQDKIATLYGIMPNHQSKTRALTIARSTPGVQGVVDKLSD